MKEHSEEFKENLLTIGRKIDCIITIGQTELHDELYSINYLYNGNILKSVMKELDFESSVDLEKGTELNFKMGIETEQNEDGLDVILDYEFGVNVVIDYEHLDYGNFIVYSSEKEEDKDLYKIVCYDKMLYSMIEYEDLGITYPITIRDYIGAICDKLNLEFENEDDEFANYDKQILNEKYLDIDGNSLGYTFRDVLDELAEVTASTICINSNDKLEIRYLSEIPTNDDEYDEEYVINERQLKDVNVDFGEKFGPVNSIVLSRSGGSDNVYLQDTESIEENGLCEIKIEDNQIMNGNDRSDYLEDILERLDGLEYYVNDYSSVGICYLDLCDKYIVRVRDNDYICIMINDEINIEQGLEENIYTELNESAETDYTKADKTDRRINQTTLIVDKQSQQIQSMITQIGDREGKTTSITQDIDHIESIVEDNIDLTRETNGENPIVLENCREGNLLELRIKGNNSVFKPLIPSDELVPSERLTPLSSVLKVTHLNDTLDEPVATYDYYDLDVNEELKQSGSNFDEFVIKDGYAYELRRIGTGGIIIENPDPINKRKFEVKLTEGTNYIDILSYSANIYARWVIYNQITNYFATNADLSSTINQTKNEINLNVTEKLDLLTDEYIEEDGLICAPVANASVLKDTINSEVVYLRMYTQQDEEWVFAMMLLSEYFRINRDIGFVNNKYVVSNGQLNIVDDKSCLRIPVNKRFATDKGNRSVQILIDKKYSIEAFVLDKGGTFIMQPIVDVMDDGDRNRNTFNCEDTNSYVLNIFRADGMPISVDEIEDMNIEYRQYGLFPVDILGGSKPFLRRIGDVYDEVIYDKNDSPKFYYIQRIGKENDEMYVLDEPIKQELTMSWESEIWLRGGATQIAITPSRKTVLYDIKRESGNKTVQKKNIIAEINLAVENDQGVVRLIGNSVEIDSDHCKLTGDGILTLQNVTTEPYIPTYAEVIKVLNYLKGEETLTPEELELYDFDNSGSITISDVIMMNDIVKGKRESTKIADAEIKFNPLSPSEFIKMSLGSEIGCQIGINEVYSYRYRGEQLLIGQYSGTSAASSTPYGIKIDGEQGVIQVDNLNDDTYTTLSGALIKLTKKDGSTTTRIDSGSIKTQNIIGGTNKTSGYCMHGIDMEHTYRCNWTGSVLNFYVDAQVAGSVSDERLKEDIKPINDDVLNAIEEIEFKQFIVDNIPNNISFGAIAQDVIKAFEKYNLNYKDYLVVYDVVYDTSTKEIYYAINYEQFNILKNACLERKVRKQDNIIKDLVERIEKLEKGGNE